MSIIEKKKDLVLALVSDLNEKLGIYGNEQYTVGFDENLKNKLKNHPNKYVKTTEAIVYDPSWKIRYKSASPLYKKTNDYSFIENGIYCFALEDSYLEDLMDLLSVLDEYFNFIDFRKKFTIYNKIKASNILDKSELYLLKLSLDKNI